MKAFCKYIYVRGSIEKYFKEMYFVILQIHKKDSSYQRRLCNFFSNLVADPHLSMSWPVLCSLPALWMGCRGQQWYGQYSARSDFNFQFYLHFYFYLFLNFSYSTKSDFYFNFLLLITWWLSSAIQRAKSACKILLKIDNYFSRNKYNKK